MAADWPSPILAAKGTLTLRVWRSEIDNCAPGAESADRTDHTIGLVQQLRRPGWKGSVSASASAGRLHEKGARARTRIFSLRATASGTSRATSPFSLRAGVKQIRTTGLDSAVSDDIDTTWDVTAAGELNGLPGVSSTPAVLPLAGYIRIAGSDPDLTGPDERTIDITAGIRTRLAF